jgi:high-affinity Fe2+/Pb2+ permease
MIWIGILCVFVLGMLTLTGSRKSREENEADSGADASKVPGGFGNESRATFRRVNPATGLLMMADGLDVEGNEYGQDSMF